MKELSAAVATSAAPDTLDQVHTTMAFANLAAPATPLAPTRSEPTLPVGYLADGPAVGPNGENDPFMKKEYFTKYPVEIASGLARKMSYDNFRKLVSILDKYGDGLSYDFEHRLSTLYKIRPQTVSLEIQGKAPRLLVDLIDALLEVVDNDTAWYSMLEHLTAIAIHMATHETPENGEFKELNWVNSFCYGIFSTKENEYV